MTRGQIPAAEAESRFGKLVRDDVLEKPGGQNASSRVSVSDAKRIKSAFHRMEPAASVIWGARPSERE